MHTSNKDVDSYKQKTIKRSWDELKQTQKNGGGQQFLDWNT